MKIWDHMYLQEVFNKKLQKVPWTWSNGLLQKEVFQYGVLFFAKRTLPTKIGHGIFHASHFQRRDQTIHENKHLLSIWEIDKTHGLKLFWMRRTDRSFIGEEDQHLKLKDCDKNSFVSQLRTFQGEHLDDASVGVDNVRGATCQPDLCYVMNRTSTSAGVSTDATHRRMLEVSFFNSSGMNDSLLCLIKTWYPQFRFCLFDGFGWLTGFFFRQKHIAYTYEGPWGPDTSKISVHLGAGLGSKMNAFVLNQNGAKETHTEGLRGANNGTLPEVVSPKFGVHLGAGFGSEMNAPFSAKTSANETPTEPFTYTSTHWILKIEKLNTFKWYNGVRVGEATNPGPEHPRQTMAKIDCAFVNPTSLNEKTTLYKQLE